MAPPRKEGTPLERTPKPRFNLGGQVSSHVSASTSNLAPTSGIYSEDPPLLPRSRSIWDASSELGGTHSGSHLPRASSLHDTMIPEEDFPHEFDLNNTKSLNPELLMREFTHDELGETNSPSSMFKSSFAKQVVHNVRKSMGSLQPTLEPIRPGLDSPVVEVRSRRSKSSHERRYSSYNPTSSSLRSHVKIDDSDSDKDTLSGNLRPKVTFGTNADDEKDLWMSKTQFIELLEKQEEAENRLNDDEHDLGLESNSFGVASSHGGDSGQFLKFRQSMPKMSSAKSLPRLSGASRRASSFVTKMNRDGNTVQPNSFNSRDALLLEYNDSKGSPSYLDQEAKMSFEDLKQKCTEMGLVFPASDWEQLKLILAQKTGNVSFDLQSDTDYKVKNDDFFDALQKVLKNHLKRRPLNCGIPDDVLKDSMKSDSGGEMESCRSSDSGLERELAEKEREICERDRELSTCYRNLAERDTELVRVRMECQRLLENNRELRDQIRDLKLYSNPRRHFELEKEVEHLKWHLDQMESSRNVYALGTSSLVTFLEEITAGLHATSPAHRKLIDATKEELSRVTRRTKRLEIQQHGRRSLDGNHSLMSRAESMPGLNLDSGLSSSQVSLISTSTTGGAGSLSTGESATLHRRHVQRSQSTNSKRSQKLPSLQENANDDEDFQPYENHSIIQRIREETAEELQNVHSRPKSQTPASRSNSSQRADSTKSTKPQKRHSFALRSTIPSSEDEAPRPMKPSNDQVTPRLSKKDKFKKSITASSDKDSGRCSLGSVSSGRSTPNLSHSTSGAPKNQSKDDDKPKDKFKSLGNIHMEPALPNAPISCAQEEHREQLLSVGKKFKRSMRNLVTRDTTLKITPKKNKAWRSSMDRNPPSLQLLSHTSFPGLPAFPMLAASHTSPWNC